MYPDRVSASQRRCPINLSRIDIINTMRCRSMIHCAEENVKAASSIAFLLKAADLA